MSRDWLDRSRIVEAAQLAVGVALLLWLVSQPDWSEIVDGLFELSAPVVLALLAVSVGGILARFATWTAVLDGSGSAGLRSAAQIDLSVNFVNQLLPSRLSGRLVAPFAVRRFAGVDLERAVAATVAHTGLYAVVYGVVSLAGLLVGVGVLPRGIVLLILLSTALYLLAGAVVLGSASGLDGTVGRYASAVGSAPGVRRLRALVADRVLEAPLELETVAPLVRELVGEPRVLASFGLAWLLSSALAPGLRLLLLFDGMGATFSPAWSLPLLVVAAYSVTLLPLTPGGIGVSEATATVVFVAVGVPAAVVVPAVLIDRFLGVYLPALCGWYPTMSVGLDEVSRDQA